MTKEQFIALGFNEADADKAAKASADELKGYIPKNRFDEVNEAKKKLEADTKEHEMQLEELKKTAGSSEELQKQIADLQAANTKKEQEYQTQLKEIQMKNAITNAINGKVHDNDLVAGMFDQTKLILSDDGKVTGLDEQLEGLKKSKAFLFKQEDTQNTKPPSGFRVGGTGSQQQQQDSNDANRNVSFKDAIAAALTTRSE